MSYIYSIEGISRKEREPKPQARNPARTMKKVARPSPKDQEGDFRNRNCPKNV